MKNNYNDCLDPILAWGIIILFAGVAVGHQTSVALYLTHGGEEPLFINNLIMCGIIWVVPSIIYLLICITKPKVKNEL